MIDDEDLDAGFRIYAEQVLPLKYLPSLDQGLRENQPLRDSFYNILERLGIEQFD